MMRIGESAAAVNSRTSVGLGSGAVMSAINVSRENAAGRSP